MPFMLLYHSLGGVYGIAWATPTADVLTALLSAVLFFPYWKKLKSAMERP